MRCLCVLLSSMFAVAGYSLSGTGTCTVMVMLLFIGDISGRVILSIVSALRLGFSFSVFVFCWVVCPLSLAIAIV